MVPAPLVGAIILFLRVANTPSQSPEWQTSCPQQVKHQDFKSEIQHLQWTVFPIALYFAMSKMFPLWMQRLDERE